MVTMLLVFWAVCQDLPMRDFCTRVLLGGSEVILDSSLRGFQRAVLPLPPQFLGGNGIQ